MKTGCKMTARFAEQPGWNVREKTMKLEITTDYIKLDSSLKMVNLVNSGGEAKELIIEGLVQVNGEQELRRGRKLYPGDRVSLGGHEFVVERAV
jgi:ribosome-associated protein